MVPVKACLHRHTREASLDAACRSAPACGSARAGCPACCAPRRAPGAARPTRRPSARHNVRGFPGSPARLMSAPRGRQTLSTPGYRHCAGQAWRSVPRTTTQAAGAHSSVSSSPRAGTAYFHIKTPEGAPAARPGCRAQASARPARPPWWPAPRPARARRPPRRRTRAPRSPATSGLLSRRS